MNNNIFTFTDSGVVARGRPGRGLYCPAPAPKISVSPETVFLSANFSPEYKIWD